MKIAHNVYICYTKHLKIVNTYKIINNVTTNQELSLQDQLLQDAIINRKISHPHGREHAPGRLPPQDAKIVIRSDCCQKIKIQLQI